MQNKRGVASGKGTPTTTPDRGVIAYISPSLHKNALLYALEVPA